MKIPDQETESMESSMPTDDDTAAFHEPLEGEFMEMEDGSAIIELPEDEEAEESSFGENLALRLTDQQRMQIGGDLVETIERDKTSREKRQKQYEDGIRRTGLGDDAPGGAQFNGASRVVHPMLAEACVDFEARAIKELMPAGGPVRTSITSADSNDEKLEVAELKRDILNLQLTRLIPEYRDELESLLSQLPMGGSQYMKLWHDGRRKRAEFIPIDHVFLPFSVTNFYSSPRTTHQQFITRQEFDARVESGLYIGGKDTSDPTFSELERSPVDIANDKIEGKEEDAYNEDGLRETYECYLDHDFTEVDDLTDGVAPYICHIDVHTEKILGVYRNWHEDDTSFTKLDWLIEFGFIPWRGAYKIGLPHLIGGLSAAATGALRALLDSAHAANAPTLLKLRAGRMVGQTTEVAVTQVQEIEGPAGIDDIRKMVTPIPFAGPNPILFQLLGALVETGKGVVATAEEKIADVSDRMPVGTSLAMIEQGSKVFAAIHMRLHASQAKLFEVLCRLNAEYPEDDWERLMGKPVDPRIFDHTDDITPVSDPNIFSEAQRYAQMQAVLQLMSDASVPYNRIEGHRRMLKLLNVPNPNDLLPEPPKPKKMDAVTENMAAVSGIPLKAFPDQDHLAHMEVHLRFILSPAYGAGPAYQGPQLMPIIQHCTEHLTMYYPTLIAQGQAMALQQGALLPTTSDERAKTVGAAASDQIAQQSLQALLQMYTQAQQLVQKKMPPPPMDPQAQVTMQVAQMEDARAKAQMQMDAQESQAKFQAETQLKQAELQMKQAEMAHQQQMDQAKLQAEHQFKMLEQQMQARMDELAQQVEVQKNEADNKQHQMTELLKNRDDNQTQIIIEQMKQSLSEMMPQQPQGGESADLNAPIKEMQRMLGEIEKAKTSDALSSIMDGLRVTMETLARPRTTQLQIGPDGKAIGAVSVLS